MHFSFTDLIPFVQPIIGVLAVVLAARIHKSIVTPLDHQRAAHLSLIAREAAALLVAENKNATWSMLLEDLVRRITSDQAAPTTNTAAIRRASASALTELGVKP